MNKKYVKLLVFTSMIVLAMVLPSAAQLAMGQEPKDLCLDTSTAYDQNFKWYNTDGPLPSYVEGHYIFSGGKSSSMYQDALSLKSVKVGESFALSAKISVKIDTLSTSSRDEFSVFITDDTKVFTGDEFGFVIQQDGPALFAYLQSPRTTEFFKIFKLDSIPMGQEKTYTLKAVYSEMNGRAIVRFFVNDILALTHDFPLVSDHEFYLVISSKKLSESELDTSRNTMRVYSACIVNLPVADVPSNADVKESPAGLLALSLTNTVTMLLTVAILITTINIYIKVRKLRKTTHSHT